MQDATEAPGEEPSGGAAALAAAIRRARGEMRQVEFAELLGVGQSVVSTWENAKVVPSIIGLAKVEKGLGLPKGVLAAEAGFFTPEAAASVGFIGQPLKRLQTGELEEALRFVRSADDLGFGVRMRAVQAVGVEDKQWLVEVLSGEVSR